MRLRLFAAIGSVVILLLASTSALAVTQRPMPASLYGWTTDNGYATARLTDAAAHTAKMSTVRVVFDEWVAAAEYVPTVRSLNTKAYVMGELLDSAYVGQYSLSQYKARTTEYLNAMGTSVDLWEIGNEINGEWLGSGAIDKAAAAFDLVEARGQRTALTLYYNPDCWESPANEMWTWLPNIPQRMVDGLDYVFLSYYEQDCSNQKFQQSHWQGVFDRLHAAFPASQTGFGEMGTRKGSSFATKDETMRRYYTLDITTPGYVGGYFWWYGYQHLTPWNQKPLFNTFNQVIQTY
jgi:hypothetical protein